MPVEKYRKKPVVVEAIQWNIDEKTMEEVSKFMNKTRIELSFGKLWIDTLEGKMFADIGDWIIKGIKNEVYPCKPDVFEKAYEKVEE